MNADADVAVSRLYPNVPEYCRATPGEPVGHLDQHQCGERIDKLSQQATHLRARRTELEDALVFTPETQALADLAILQRYVSDAIRQAEPTQLRQLRDALVAKVAVTDRDHIQPYFYLFATLPEQDQGQQVRTLTETLAPAGFEPARR